MVIFADPNGLLVALINHDPTDMHRPSGTPIFACGKFGEYAMGVKSFQDSAAFWQKLGFKILHESSEPYPWGILYDQMMVLGLHQTDEFSGPHVTYFAPDMLDRTTQLKEIGYRN
ncbi:hypothetical protein KFU94_62420 [Chloroflexi bacterium TSY]|nr:hypothetical protein [Chloroflexi bacterium TSY]